MIIDHHAHLVPEGVLSDMRAGRFGPEVTIEAGEECEILVTQGVVLDSLRRKINRLPKESFDVDLRLSHMKDMGVDRQILSAITGMTFYEIDSGLNREISAALNDGLADLAKKMPGKFSCMANVPLQDPPAAAAELERAAGLGHIGVKIGSNVAGENLDDPALDVFWEKAEALGFPILLHPGNIIGARDRMKDYYLHNLISNPLDTTIAAASIIFGGVLDRFPDLKIILAHMGGFTPWIRGRWQHGYEVREEPGVRGAGPPEDYFGKFYYDTVIHNADCLEFAVKTIGADNILYGTDCPWDVGCLGPAREIAGLSRLDAADREKILSGNTRRLYGI